MIIKILAPKFNRSGNTAICKCDYCGKEFNRKYANIKNAKNNFCDRKCLGRYQSGENCYFHNHPFNNRIGLFGKDSPSWKGGRVKQSKGYIYIFVSEHPYSDKRGYVLEHRLVMEKFLGRYLTKEECVHHINGIKDDNRLENLMLFENDKIHKKYVNLLKLLNIHPRCV